MSNSVTYSSELMKNYLHASIMDPDDVFEVLQDNLGNALLFSIGTDGIFYVTQEVPHLNNTVAKSGTPSGWNRTDLSSTQMSRDFPNMQMPLCKTISVNQNIVDGTIGLAMVVTVDGNDLLYLSMGNSASDTSWLQEPVWVPSPYNYIAIPGNPPATPSPLVILNVFISESVNGQYIIIDIVNAADVQRYYIIELDPVPLWQLHALAFDLTPSMPYSSCIGRNADASVDGMYTFGQVGQSPQFMFCPLWNTFGSAPPSPTLLNLPLTNNPEVSLQPQSMASFRNGNPDQATDLFVTASDINDNGCLYYFNSAIHGHTVNGIEILKNPLFIDVLHLYADLSNGVVTVWGLNNDNIIFYTTCPYAEITKGLWSPPMVLLTEVDMISPYINKVNDGNTIFAVGGNELHILIKSPVTGLWKEQQIMLPAIEPLSSPVSFSSYTTRIHLLDANSQPLADTPMMVSSSTRMGFYINNLYTVLDTNPIVFNTDSFGVITMVESVKKLQATKIIVSEIGGTPILINPMDEPFKKAAALNSVSLLQNAVITNVDGTTRPLVAPGTTRANLQTVAVGNVNLQAAYSQMSEWTVPLSQMTRPKTLMLAGFEGSILADVGDIFNWLETGIDSIINIVKDDISGIWYFIANIAGQLYHGILDCVEKVVGAIEWVYNAIKTAIEDLILFLEFLFEWKDILATHNVLKNILIQYTQNAINALPVSKSPVTSAFATIQNDINNWVNIPGFTQTPAGTSASSAPVAGNNSAAANLGFHHFQGNSSNITSSFSPPAPTLHVFQDLIDLLVTEENIADEALEAIANLVEQFNNLSITQIIEQLVAILAGTLLNATEQILIMFLDVLLQLAEDIMGMLTAPIDIPVLSWLYKEISGNDLSCLDLLCLISAIPATLVYKIAEDSAPFPHGAALTTDLINATSFIEIQNLFQAQKHMTTSGEISGFQTETIIADDPMKVLSAVTGMCAFIGTQAICITSTLQPEPKSNAALVSAVANIFYTSPNITSMMFTGLRWDQQFNGILTEICILKGFTLDYYYAGSTPAKVCECVLNAVWNVPVIVNIIENPDWKEKNPALIQESVGNFAFNVGGMLAPINNKPQAEVAQLTLMEIYGILALFVGFVNSTQEY